MVSDEKLVVVTAMKEGGGGGGGGGGTPITHPFIFSLVQSD
jgi:hypothetical protein